MRRARAERPSSTYSRCSAERLRLGRCAAFPAAASAGASRTSTRRSPAGPESERRIAVHRARRARGRPPPARAARASCTTTRRCRSPRSRVGICGRTRRAREAARRVGVARRRVRRRPTRAPAPRRRRRDSRPARRRGARRRASAVPPRPRRRRAGGRPTASRVRDGAVRRRWPQGMSRSRSSRTPRRRAPARAPTATRRTRRRRGHRSTGARGDAPGKTRHATGAQCAAQTPRAVVARASR